MTLPTSPPEPIGIPRPEEGFRKALPSPTWDAAPPPPALGASRAHPRGAAPPLRASQHQPLEPAGCGSYLHSLGLQGRTPASPTPFPPASCCRLKARWATPKAAVLGALGVHAPLWGQNTLPFSGGSAPQAFDFSLESTTCYNRTDVFTFNRNSPT